MDQSTIFLYCMSVKCYMCLRIQTLSNGSVLKRACLHDSLLCVCAAKSWKKWTHSSRRLGRSIWKCSMLGLFFIIVTIFISFLAATFLPRQTIISLVLLNTKWLASQLSWRWKCWPVLLHGTVPLHVLFSQLVFHLACCSRYCRVPVANYISA